MNRRRKNQKEKEEEDIYNMKRSRIRRKNLYTYSKEAKNHICLFFVVVIEKKKNKRMEVQKE